MDDGGPLDALDADGCRLPGMERELLRLSGSKDAGSPKLCIEPTVDERLRMLSNRSLPNVVCMRNNEPYAN